MMSGARGSAPWPTDTHPVGTPNLENDIAALIEAEGALRQSDAGGLDFSRERSAHPNAVVNSTRLGLRVRRLRLNDLERATQTISFSDARGTSTALVAFQIGPSAC